jgi:hypothetical protein
MFTHNFAGLTLITLALAGAACGNGVSLGSDGGSAGGVSMAGASGNAGGPPSKACDNPRQLDGGWEVCGNGERHRQAPSTCTYTVSSKVFEPTMGDQCHQDSECTEKAYGYCSYPSGFIDGPSTRCFYGCVVDDDCGPDQICVCSQAGSDKAVGACLRSPTCKSDQDCGAGSLCTDYWEQPGCPDREFGCQAAQDECRSDMDCPSTGLPFCASNGEHRACAGISCQE